MDTQSDLRDITPPYALFYFLSLLISIVLTIFHSQDPEWWYFSISFCIAAGLSTYYYHLSTQKGKSLQGSSVVFFILVWLGIHTFADKTVVINYQYFDLTRGQFHYIVILPLVMLWIIPQNQETFFGLQEASEETKIKSIWKYSILIIILMKLFQLWTILEFLILIPLITETTRLHQHSKEATPVLTLFIQQEIANKFAVPLSMARSVLVIMVAFLFEILSSRLWLLVILLYFFAAFIWGINSIIPESARTDQAKINQKEIVINATENYLNILQERKTTLMKRDDSSDHLSSEIKELEQKISRLQAKISDKRVKINQKREIINKHRSISEQPMKIEDEVVLRKEETAVLSLDGTKQIQDSSAITIGERAFNLGQKVRTELQKPQYNLNHILSTLSQEDFSSAFLVGEPGLTFPSTRGKWSPPVGLILFPVDLEEYDYRRVGEILLLGFNEPKKDKDLKFEFDLGGKEYNTKISENAIKFGDIVFNMKTLIVSKEQWAEIRPKLEIVTSDDDISYTGFETLHDLQEKLATLSEKWIELREKAKEATVNFVAGVMGATDPIFLGSDQVEDQYEDMLEEGEYIVEDTEDEVLEDQ